MSGACGANHQHGGACGANHRHGGTRGANHQHGGATAALGAFVAGLTHDALPDDVVDRVLAHTLDHLGAALLGATMPWNAVVRRYALGETPDGPCTILGATGTGRPEWAALANATAGHGFEIDDYALPALAHPGCVVVPAALAVAESRGARGHAALTALAAGFEVVLRLGLATTPSLTSDRGFHVTGVHGVFGAAAVAGRLAGLDPATMASAFGLAASQAGGVTEYTRSGGEVKRLHAGLAAMGGIRAARLAAEGFPGPPTAIEGERGLLHAFVANARPEALTDELGTAWRVHGLAVKRFCVCAGLHAPIEAAAALRPGLDLSTVDEVVVGTDAATRHHVGAIGPRPKDMTGAQFSAEHAVATRLVLGGNGPAEYARLRAAGFDLPDVTRVAERVRLEVDAQAEAVFPHRLLARVTIRAGGRELTARAEARGTPALPLSGDEVRAKFTGLAAPVVGDRTAAAVVAAVDALRDDGPVDAVTAPLRRTIEETP
ncbi:MAG: MmgE/PrpD family protein [Actinophytocola sp.]|uniref:MmgE/PrpD family protein n=1 Tax=Actinophytocola sp. TaxID=1872138 RepID=UPI003C75E2D8